MSHFLKAAILLIVIFCTPAYASQLTDKIEEHIKNKEWKEVYSILDKLPVKTSKEQGIKSKLTDATRSVVSFIKDSDLCEKMDNESARSKEAVSCYENLLKHSQYMPKKAPFSKELIDDINMKTKFAKKRIGEINEDIDKEKAEVKATREAKKLEAQKKREEEEQRRLLIIAQEKEAQRKLHDAQEKAFESNEYKTFEAGCSICECLQDKKISEAQISQEKVYSKKYGTVNLSKIDGYKQRIMFCDNTIKERKLEFKKLTGKAFKTSECKKIELSCEDALEELRAKLIEKYIESEDEPTKKLITEKH